MSDVAVIIPCFNNEAFLAQAIESVLNQKGIKVEVVVVDDGSSDDSVKVAASFGDRVKILRQENQGACAARNYGLDASNAPYVKFLDADDWLEPDSLAIQYTRIRELKENEIVFGKAHWVDEQGRVTDTYEPVGYQSGDRLSLVDILKVTPLTSCPLHKRSLLNSVGGFDIRCMRSQEYDLHVRLAIAGCSFVYVPTLCYHYRQHVSAGRISGRDGQHGILLNKLEALDRHLELIQSRSEPATEDVNIALSQAYWRVGRLASRAKDISLSRRAFSQAKWLGGNMAVVGSRKYRLLSKFMNPVGLG